MKKTYYRKLIRDKIPQRIKQAGGKYSIRTLSGSKYQKELLRKISEEAGGLSHAKSKMEVISEMGDLLDVIDEVKKAFKITADELSKSRKKEFKRKGGFKNKIFLVWSEDTGYRSNERIGRK